MDSLSSLRRFICSQSTLFFISDKRHLSSSVWKWLSVNWTTWGWDWDWESDWKPQQSLSSIYSSISKALCCQKCRFPDGSAACHALPLAMAIRSDTVLMGTPLRVTFTWIKSVAGERLEPSAFSKWTWRYPEEYKQNKHYKHATMVAVMTM